MKKTAALEFCITDLKGAQIAANYKADRIELCTDLKVGGVTPSYGLIKASAEIIETHVLIRPRAGDFYYQDEEIRIMIANIIAAGRAGATGAVFGCLAEDGTIDVATNKQLIDVCKAQGIEPSFHRAIDRVTSDKIEALESLIDLGFNRILTAGHAPSAIDGMAQLKLWRDKAAGRIQLMAGGGVKPENAAELLDIGLDALHCSIHQKEISANQMGDQLAYDLPKAAQMKALVDVYNRR